MARKRVKYSIFSRMQGGNYRWLDSSTHKDLIESSYEKLVINQPGMQFKLEAETKDCEVLRERKFSKSEPCDVPFIQVTAYTEGVAVIIILAEFEYQLEQENGIVTSFSCVSDDEYDKVSTRVEWHFIGKTVKSGIESLNSEMANIVKEGIKK